MSPIKKLLLASALTTPLSFAMHSNAGTDNYIEYGVGAAQIHSLDSEENKYYQDEGKFGGVAKLLVGGRISHSANTWFELGGAYSDGVRVASTKLKYRYLSAGLKFTTDPKRGFSGFVRLGGGKTFSTTKTQGEPVETAQENNYYAGTGLSFRLDIKRSVNLEVQRFGKRGEDTGLNTMFLTFNQFL